MERNLNVDIPGNITEFESLIDKVLPKKFLYKIVLRGKGLEFEGYRDFSFDEDASNIDWKASVRSNSLLSRQYIEERDYKIMFIVDMGENMVFGSQDKLKCEYITELLAAFSHIIIKTGDRIGFILYNKTIFNFSYPLSGKNQHDAFIYELINPDNYEGIGDFTKIMDDVKGILNRTIDLVIFISDFLQVKKENKEDFEFFGNLFETIILSVKDPIDITFPDMNKEIVIEDYKTGEKILINPHIAKNIYEKNAYEQTQLTRKIFQESNIDYLELFTNEDYKPILAKFLKKRVESKYL